MKERFFFVIYLHNEAIKTILDPMRIIADPKQRNLSHITVKGPYRNAQKKRLVQDSKLIQGQDITVHGAGNFFIENQNTVFLRCEEKEELYTIWKSKEEKTYKEFHPHITIYDGDNRKFAKNLFNTINSHNINFSFKVDKLELYSSADKSRLFNLRAQANYSTISSMAGRFIDQANIDSLTDDERLLVIDKMCELLEQVKNLTRDSIYRDKTKIEDYELLIEA